MTILTMNHTWVATPRRSTNPLRVFDVLVAGLGLAIAYGGFFASEVSWALTRYWP